MNQRTTSFEMFCFLAGGLAGAGLAWLWAPTSGKAARQMIGRRLRDAAEGARELKDELVTPLPTPRGEAEV